MGYYKSSFQKDGTISSYSLTQFEVSSFYNLYSIRGYHFVQATAARRAFPCWDEPLLKATFAITMISRADTVNLSNMPVISEKNCSAEVMGNNDEELIALLSSLTIHTEDHVKDEWKITRFMTTPLVGSVLLAQKCDPNVVNRCQHTSLLMQMDHLRTWKVHTRVR